MRELEVHRLCALDEEFRCACEDYLVAVKALRHWERVENNPIQAAEYRQIADEIAAEIAASLDAASASFQGPAGDRSGQPRWPAHGFRT